MTIGSASAPASSANLGPGFDTLGLALALRCTATVELAESMTISENGSTRRLASKDMIAKAVMLAIGQPAHVTLDNGVPRARGMGSSSAVAASVAGAALKAARDDAGAARVYEIVSELEGHGDNAAAAVFGGFVAVAEGGIKRLDLHPSIRIVVGIPDGPLRTAEARAALSDSVPREAVCRSLSRLVFLIEGLRDANPEVLSHAAGDELHEAPRSSLSLVTGEMIDAAKAGGALHAAWSGAGPTTIAFTTPESQGRVIGAMSGVLGTSGEVLTLDVDYDGLL
jgi:homoserine kinase